MIIICSKKELDTMPTMIIEIATLIIALDNDDTSSAFIAKDRFSGTTGFVSADTAFQRLLEIVDDMTYGEIYKSP